MAKGYWIGHVQVHDVEAYKKYVEGATPAYREYGARFIVRGGKEDRVEADDLGSRHVVIEFDSLEKAQACYNSATYQEARKHRLGASTGRLVIVEGFE
ncbi:MAG: DUF1330 domain-containing protein [Nitratireductor sp.]|nr:DUF1330 domain-containing protein [Nitratireductor sp.]